MQREDKTRDAISLNSCTNKNNKGWMQHSPQNNLQLARRLQKQKQQRMDATPLIASVD